jgi:hypothetical protein
MALSSPGVEVKVIDESFYTPAEPGTTPLIIVASAQDKSNGAGTGTAPGTTKANAGTVYLLTSQRDLADTFGDPIFKTDANNNPVHAGEQNEYGLQAAYSLLGVSNRAFVVRADLDLSQLDASADPPIALPANGTHWMDTSTTTFGFFEWNGAPISTTGGQKFANKVPLVITDSTRVDPSTSGPKTSLGAIGDYAIVMTDTDSDTPALTTSHPGTLWYKSKGNSNAGVTPGSWVLVGSNDWAASLPVVAGTVSNPAFTPGDDFYINGNLITASGSTVASLATDINNAFNLGNGPVYAQAWNNKLEIYVNNTIGNDEADSTTSNALVIAAGFTGSLVATSVAASALGIKTGTYYGPKLQISKHTDVPQWKSTSNAPRPTGSIWVKTTEPNLGARWRVKRWNGTTALWEAVDSPIYLNGHDAIFGLDKAGGGENLSTGSLYVQANYDEDNGTDSTPRVANFKLYRRSSAGMTTITSPKVENSQFTNATTYTFRIAESLVGTNVLGDYNGDGTYSYKTCTFTGSGTGDTDAGRIATAINAAGFTNIEAEVDSQNRVVIRHKLGGDFRLTNVTNNPLTVLGLSAYDYEPSNATFATGILNLQDAPVGDTLHDFVASLWSPLVYVSNGDAPGSLTDDGRLWYSSVIDEIDIMIHDGSDWVGYLSPTSPYYDASPGSQTDPNGPIVSATAPETQSDGTALVTGDLWISTDDIENFPQIYRFNNALTAPVTKRWELLDKTDQSTEDGVLFADARYNTAGSNSDEAGTIVDLLTSDYLDPDAPDPALYPRGMLLWNLRRSGFNVKKFQRNYIDVAADNTRFNGEAMEAYYPHRWTTESPNQGDGSGSFGRKSQRAVVVKALQATANANQDIRDDESRIFNLIACPGYPELIGEMISLNYDRGLTALVVGDSPARLTPDATSLLAWGSNQRLAFEDNDLGAVSYDEYMAMFYPWGFTSDNFGNNVVVPPSHMILRTIALNDQVAYPWFAPAGIRRGGITNASAVGYVDSQEGEFKSVALNVGQRDTLYEQKINPITFLTGTGLVNYGQKTRAKGFSALDRINVARLVIYLRSQLNKLAKPYIFEPNDKITRDEIKLAVDSLLLELVGQRALYDFLVVCDESNNTPSRIDRNELYIDIAIEPVKAVEFIYIPLRLKNTGEIAALG